MLQKKHAVQENYLTQEERLNYLIPILQEQTGNIGFLPAKTLAEKKDLFRALMNVWQGKTLPDKYVTVQDEYLQEELKAKTVQNAQDLKQLQNNISVWQGDITLLAVDAIVNAANKSLLGCLVPLHKCIDNAIHSFAGLQLRIKCREIITAQGHEEATGQAKITPAYNLPCRYVLHTVGPIVGAKLTKRDEDLLRSCYVSCMQQAAEYDLKSIAFCCISTGVFHFPNERAAEIAVETVKHCQQKFAPDMHVIFNVFKDIDLTIYTKLLQENPYYNNYFLNEVEKGFQEADNKKFAAPGEVDSIFKKYGAR